MMQGHKGEVTDMAFSMDGCLLVTSSKDSSLCLWDSRTGTALCCIGLCSHE